MEDEVEMAAITVEILSENYQITHALTGEEGLRLALRTPFDLMVFDRRLPGISGTELVAKVRRAGTTTPILLLTALGSIRNKVEGLDQGATDYLVKPFDFEELAARLRVLHRGYRAAARRRDIGEWTLLPEENALVDPYGYTVGLTESETRMLDTLSSSPEHVFSRAELLAACFPTGESDGTIESYVHYIRRKSAPGVIRTVRGRGYQIGDGS